MPASGSPRQRGNGKTRGWLSVRANRPPLVALPALVERLALQEQQRTVPVHEIVLRLAGADQVVLHARLVEPSELEERVRVAEARDERARIPAHQVLEQRQRLVVALEVHEAVGEIVVDLGRAPGELDRAPERRHRVGVAAHPLQRARELDARARASRAAPRRRARGTPPLPSAAPTGRAAGRARATPPRAPGDGGPRATACRARPRSARRGPGGARAPRSLRAAPARRRSTARTAPPPAQHPRAATRSSRARAAPPRVPTPRRALPRTPSPAASRSPRSNAARPRSTSPAESARAAPLALARRSGVARCAHARLPPGAPARMAASASPRTAVQSPASRCRSTVSDGYQGSVAPSSW